MAINKNHLFEDLDGVKCAIVEAGITAERVSFLKTLLEFNNYTVVVVPTPVKAKPAPAEGAPPPPPEPELFTVGVTDVVFNATNAIFGRLLKTPDKRVVTMAYWLQQEAVSRDDIPYFDAGK